MTKDAELEAAFAIIRKLFADQESRIEAATITRIMNAAQENATAQGDGTRDRPQPHKKNKGKRAPKGAAKALVDRVLKEVGAEGIGLGDIQSKAKTPIEKLVSYSTIRLALEQGKNKKYRNAGRKWYWLEK